MIKGDLLSLTVATVDADGAGVALTDGDRRIHVPFALPGERVEATVEHLSPHGPDGWAQLIRVIEPSPARVEPACPSWGRCGGCVLQHWRYDEQLAYKRAELSAALVAAGIECEVGACVPSPLTVGYRNKSKLVAARGAGGELLLGGYAPRSHQVIDLAGCAVAEAPLEAAASSLRELANRLGVCPFDERTGDGDLRHAILRLNHGGEVMAVFVVARRGGLNVVELARTFREARPQVVGVVENLHPDPSSNVLFGEQEPDQVLDGVQAIEERIGGARLRLSPRAFLQVNRGVAQRLYTDVAAAAALTSDERAIDVYCGVGGIAITLAATAREVIGIEEHAAAVADARAGADLSNVTNARFFAADAAVALADPEIAGTRADVVILNPPRKGCAPSVLDATAHLAPRAILYVSCSPPTLARDLARLATLGYHTRRVTPYDMLPHTPHVEALAILTR